MSPTTAFYVGTVSTPASRPASELPPELRLLVADIEKAATRVDSRTSQHPDPAAARERITTATEFVATAVADYGSMRGENARVALDEQGRTTHAAVYTLLTQVLGGLRSLEDEIDAGVPARIAAAAPEWLPGFASREPQFPPAPAPEAAGDHEPSGEDDAMAVGEPRRLTLLDVFVDLLQHIEAAEFLAAVIPPLLGVIFMIWRTI
jgi:hypothetical protein